MMNNRFARQALKEAATRVNSGVRQGVSTLVEQETATLRARVEQLEHELDDMKRRLDRLERDASGR